MMTQGFFHEAVLSDGETRPIDAVRNGRGQIVPQKALRHVATGMSYREIADMLVVSHRTVQNHVQNILGKLQLHNRVQLARYAVARGLVDPGDEA